MSDHAGTANDGLDLSVQEPSDDEGKLESKSVKALLKEYKTARKFDIWARRLYVRDRNVASGRASKNWASDANLIGAFIDILVSFLYAKDPDVTALPAAVVGDTTQDAADFAETASIVVGKLWKKGRLKKAARKAVRSSLSVGPGWLKVIMTHETRKDPEVKAKLNDLEDNVQRLQAKQIELQEGELDADETKVAIADLKLLQEGLQAKLEVAHRFGLAIDFVQADDMQVSIDVPDITDHLDADWNGNEIYIRVDELRGRFKRLTEDDILHVAEYYQRIDKRLNLEDGDHSGIQSLDINTLYGRFQPSSAAGADGDDIPFARVIEIWDKRDNHIKTIIDGIGRWAVAPYPPPYATSRFYPYFNIAFFEVDGERHPQSLSDRLKKLQEEYASKRSNSRLASERSIPGVIFDQQGITAADMKKIEAAVAQEFVGINPTKGDDIRKLFAEKPIGKIDPRIYDTSATLADMERISGVQEAKASTVTTAKTATEAKIQEGGFASRTGADRDNVEGMLQDLAEYTTELALQSLPIEFVQRLAGPRAFWPTGMDFEDIITLVELDIKAGSTGKPDQENLRQSWSVLLPLVTQIMTQIQQAQFMGNLPLAEALKNVLRETMRRLDERISIDQFIPQGDLPNLQGVAGLPGTGDAEPPTPAPGNAADANTLV